LLFPYLLLPDEWFYALKSLPLCRLSVLQPIVSAIRARGIDPEPVLASAGLTEEAVLTDDASVHIMVVHQFLENAAAATRDPTFAASVGLCIDTTGWPILQSALNEARSLGDFLSIYVSRANELATSVQSFLEIRGRHAIFGEKRVFKPTIPPAQNDGFMAALAYSILKHALGHRLDSTQVTLIVCEPKALPSELEKATCLSGDDMGFRVQFPSEWLALRIGESATIGSDSSVANVLESHGFLSGFRALVKRSVGSGRFSAGDAAKLVHMTQGQLARRLSRFDTDISSEIAAASIGFAKDQLSQSRRPIGEIAHALGFADAANFARAFRKQAGVTPSQYRRDSIPLDDREDG
jgi:AraC-like DNA-binding protein